MKVAMMQPTFLPWQGFFELIYQTERFIILDDFQFSVQSYHQRNRLFVNKGQVDWYSVPIQKSLSFGEQLNHTLINEIIPWRIKMWKRIQQNYSKASCYPLISPFIEKWLFEKQNSLAAQNIAFIKMACELLCLKREFILSSASPSVNHRSTRVAELLRLSGADSYYCASGSFDYMLADGLFPLNNVKVFFQDFQPKAYPQKGSKNSFIPYLSVLDAFMNIGPELTMNLIAKGTEKWLTWDEMKERRNNFLQGTA
ncbi:MAG: WbqC family protein [Desulfobacterales bacterium]|nr:WbqC family protein [Desulfobacterales bacterium]